MERHIVHADDMGGRVEGHTLPADAKKRHEPLLLDEGLKAAILLRHPALGNGALGQGQKIGEGIKGRVLVLERPAEGGQVHLLHRIHQGGVEDLAVGVELGAEVAVAPGKIALRRRRGQLMKAQGKHRAAKAGAVAGKGGGKPLGQRPWIHG